jgi:hypothetical protein
MFRWVQTFAPVVLACMEGDFERAEELTNRSAELGSASPARRADDLRRQIHAIYSGALALSYCELEEMDKAREEREQLSYTGITFFGPVERYLGLAATCLGRHGDAEEHFGRAAETCEQIGAPTWLARTPPRVGADAEGPRADGRSRARRAAPRPDP